MNQQQQDGQAALAASFDTLRDRVYAPAFLGVLADGGVVPRTEKQAATLLRIGEMLLAADRAERAKQAEVDGDFYDQACGYLEQALSGAAPEPAYADPRAVKAAAAQLAADPEIAAAAAAMHRAFFGA